jgi:putative ABC transport system substrate-binding protein
MFDMRRREFITLLGGVAAAGPLAARAQQADRMRRIGVLTYLAAHDPDLPPRVAAFAQGLQELGWIDGGNVRIEYRWGAGDTERYRDYAAELISLAPDVILVSSGSALAARIWMRCDGEARAERGARGREKRPGRQHH